MVRDLSRRQGFTLVELLVVVGIISLLISILLPALSKARRNAQSVVDLSNIRQVAVSLLNYSIDNKGKMLPAEPGPPIDPAGAETSLNWVADTSWTALTTNYKIPVSAYGCNTLDNIRPQWPLCGLYTLNWVGGNCAIIGWNYLGGRNEATPADRTYIDQTGTHSFLFAKSYADKNSTSKALLTCMNYDACDNSRPWESISPHYKGTSLFIPRGGKWKSMEGLNVAFLDGHAGWVPLLKMVKYVDPDNDWVYVPGPTVRY